MNELKNQKAVLGKLLAGENISVQHKKVRTASFDVKNRVLILPIYKENISEVVYDTFVAHEVGHALWTPNDETLFEDMKLFNYINLVEDVRIEKRIKAKFGGLNRSFVAGYDELWNDGFFGVSEDEVPNLSFADRLNLHAKIGLPIEFTVEEQDIVDRVKAVISFSEVIDLAKEIRDYCKDLEQEQKKSTPKNKSNSDKDDSNDVTCIGCNNAKDAMSTDGNNDRDDENEEDGNTNRDDLDDEDDSDSNDLKVNEKNDEESKSKSEEGESKSEESESDEWDDSDVLTTQKFFDSNIENVIDEQSIEPKYFKIPKFDLSKIIYSTDDVTKMINETRSYFLDANMRTFQVTTVDDDDMNKFRRDNLSVINHLAKQFELKKAAEIYKRSLESKSGTLDVNKIYRYSYDDNIFKRNTTFPEGKNHGLIMLLDLSGSMDNKIIPTIQQTLNLALFCRKAGIAFEVFGFVEEGCSVTDDIIGNGIDNLILPSEKLKLVHFLSSSQNAAKFADSSKNLLC